jgi:hypothetical protein
MENHPAGIAVSSARSARPARPTPRPWSAIVDRVDPCSEAAPGSYPALSPRTPPRSGAGAASADQPATLDRMTVELSPFFDVRHRASELGCAIPDGLALLPRNFATAETRGGLIHDAEGLSVRAAWRSEGIAEARLKPDGELWPAAQENAADWIGPTIFLGSSLWVSNPALVSVALGVVSNYVTDLFRGRPPAECRASLSLVIEDESGETRRLDYHGSPAGIAELPNVIKEMRR